MINYWHWKKLVIWTSIICITSTIQGFAHEVVQDEQKTVELHGGDNSEPNKEPIVNKEEPVKQNKLPATVIVVAQKVDNPPEWNSWTPVASTSTNNVTATKRISNLFPPVYSTPVQNSHQQPLQQSHYTKGSKKVKKSDADAWGLDKMQSRVMEYGKMLFSNFMTSMTSVAKGQAKTGTFEEHSETEGYHVGRSLINWINRIFGIDGKSLGEFLREYQVHVLYDLVFTFFKWVFFLYVGLLIP